MKGLIFSTLALALTVLPATAQKPGPIKLPGLGTCPDSCLSIRNTVTGALIACCGAEADGCIDCAPSCVANCNGGNGRYGGCVDLGDDEKTCSKGCELLCDSTVDADRWVWQDYTICTVGGQYVDPVPEGCPTPA